MGLLTRERIFFLTIYDGGPYHIETSFYMLETFVMKELNKRLHDFKWRVAYYQEEEVFERKMSTQESGMLLQYEKKTMAIRYYTETHMNDNTWLVGCLWIPFVMCIDLTNLLHNLAHRTLQKIIIFLLRN